MGPHWSHGLLSMPLFTEAVNVHVVSAANLLPPLSWRYGAVANSGRMHRAFL